jgi:hypothetical protein
MKDLSLKDLFGLVLGRSVRVNGTNARVVVRIALEFESPPMNRENGFLVQGAPLPVLEEQSVGVPVGSSLVGMKAV